MDLAEKATTSNGMKKLLGVILIPAINLAGIAIIVRIERKGD